MIQTCLRGLATVAAIAIALPAAAQKKPSDIPLEDFFKRPQYREMILSPDGTKLAALTPLKGRDNLVVVDLDKRTSTVITDFEKLDAAAIFWVNDKRLCLRVVNGQEVTGEPNYRGMYCINANGEDLRDFTTVGGVGGKRGLVPLAPVAGDSDEYIMEMAQRSRRSWDVYRFNTVTGRYTILSADSPGDVAEWVLDRNLVPRIAVSIPQRDIGDRGKGIARVATVWHRASADAQWEKLWEYKTGGAGGDEDVFSPVAFDYDNETLYVSTNKGRDKAAIYAYDTKNRKMGNLLLEHPLMDVEGSLIFSRVKKRLVGIGRAHV